MDHQKKENAEEERKLPALSPAPSPQERLLTNISGAFNKVILILKSFRELPTKVILLSKSLVELSTKVILLLKSFRRALDRDHPAFIELSECSRRTRARLLALKLKSYIIAST